MAHKFNNLDKLYKQGVLKPDQQDNCGREQGEPSMSSNKLKPDDNVDSDEDCY